MPLEWNMMTSDIRGLGLPVGAGTSTTHDDVDNAIPTENSNLDVLPNPEVESQGPYEFTRERYPSRRYCDHLKKKIKVGSEFGSDEVMARMEHMHEENECRNNRRAPKMEAPRPRKGKEKAAYVESDIPDLRQHWHDEYEDLLQGVPESMPPFHEVNHEIPLIDMEKQYHYHLPRCPNSLKGEFNKKVEKYTWAGWWQLTAASQAAPMLCLPKKDRHLHMVIDCRQQNENMVKDVTPMPDQDGIREDVARAKYRSKIDLSDAYEQVRIVPDDMWKTAFATIRGTFTSAVMQQGDCNAPTTFQRLMTSIFQDIIGVFMHVYIDDIFVFSDLIEEHEEHL
ncbi:uncharacterized protein ARMOST_19896 [Armillaria ostoyae]|uniref:Reverse transcriptase domain-containing protein n=1 Tax=Armillaria ostoyae TaxID=47428 RepID=A0A284S5U7_ARMOS|nr:uncharacterized protein ARMOST_19896 [Armillaria ostoyae]